MICKTRHVISEGRVFFCAEVIDVIKKILAPEAVPLRENHLNSPTENLNLKAYTQVDQTAKRARPRLRRVRIRRLPVWVRMRTRKPDTRLRLRLVPSRVRLVMGLGWAVGQFLSLPASLPSW